MLRSAGSSARLSKDDGEPTKAGLFWQEITGQQLPDSGFSSQTPFREGNTEYIKLRTGRNAVTRRLNLETGDWVFTKLGLKFYKKLRRNYVVNVPVTIHGTPAEGRHYTKKATLPINKLGITVADIALAPTLEERLRKVKRLVLDQLPRDGPIYNLGYESYTLDDEGDWAIMEETVGVHPDSGKGEVYLDEGTVNHRRMGVLDVRHQLYKHEAICKEAFEVHDDKKCCARQIAAVLGLDFNEVCEMLSSVSTAFANGEGCSPQEIYDFAEKYNYGMVCLHNNVPTLSRRGDPILAFQILGNHGYFFKKNSVAKTVLKWVVPESSREQLKRKYRLDKAWERPLHFEVGVDLGSKGAHHYFCHDDEVAAIRRHLLANKIVPKISLRGPMQIRNMSWSNTKISVLCEDWEKVEGWFARLKIDYCGQGLAGGAFEALQCLIKRRNVRVPLTGEEKAKILEDYNFQCAFCASRPRTLEFDHIVRHSCSFGGAPQTQPLCKSCHKLKTSNESRNMDGCVFGSSFSKRAWDDYVESERLPALVWKCKELLPTATYMVADVKRCRRRALEFTPHKIPIFSALDNVVERTKYELGDLNFVTKKPKNVIWQFGFTGSGWQHRVLTEHLLHFGVIEWADIKYTLSSVGSLPSGLFDEPLRLMSDAWEGDELMAKRSINAMIGIMSIDHNWMYNHSCSTRQDDARVGAAISSFQEGGQTIWDFCEATRILSNVSYRPVHDMCLSSEHAMVGKILFLLKSTRQIPCELRTDAVLYKTVKRKDSNPSSIRFRDLHLLRQRYSDVSGVRKLDQRVDITPIMSEEPVFRVHAATEADMLQGTPAEPRRCCEPPNVACQWKYIASAGEEIMKGGSVFIEGVAGTGKTTLAQGIIERMRSLGKKCLAISKTHVASSKIDGNTADSFVRRRILAGRPGIDILWCDEVGQFDVGLWTQLSKLQFLNKRIQFILSGDVCQFAPIGNCWGAGHVSDDAFWKSHLFFDLCGGKRVRLTECRRSERELFDAYNSLPPLYGSLDIKPIVKSYAERFPVKGLTRHNLTLSHELRVKLNGKLNRLWAPVNSFFLKVGSKESRQCAQQNMLLWQGLELLGCVATAERGVKNGMVYKIASVDETVVEFEGLAHKFTYDEVRDMFRLSFARTLQSCQGVEFDEPLTIHELGHINFSLRALFVGLSRAKKIEWVHCAL